MSGDGHGGAAAELGGGQGAGEKKRGGEGIPVRPLPWAGVACGRPSAAACGSGPRNARRPCYGARREGLEVAEVAVGQRSGVRGSLYRVSKEVERCGVGGGGR